MEVILLERVRNLGNLGDKVNVKAGFGRNYLIPQHKAVPANEENVRMFEAKRAELEKKAEEKLSTAKEKAEKLNDLKITISANASDEGKLYGSVGVLEITQAITDAGVPVEKREVSLSEGAFHNVGEYEVNLQVHSDVTATVKLEIVPE